MIKRNLDDNAIFTATANADPDLLGESAGMAAVVTHRRWVRPCSRGLNRNCMPNYARRPASSRTETVDGA